ncbi:hypothetical protein PENTCL1PPCAC_26376, partial [Pristionchus entomophagus]
VNERVCEIERVLGARHTHILPQSSTFHFESMMPRHILLALLPLLALACGPDYDPWFDGYCFRTVSASSYSTAQKACDDDGTFVTSIHSEEENKQLRDLAGSGDFFIGLICDANKNFAWEDESNVTYTNFRDASTSCSSLPSDSRFVMQSDGKWAIGSANTAVCRQLARTIDTCDEFELYDAVRHSACVRLFKKAQTWQDAESVCQSHNAHLASIHDSSFNSYVRRSAISYNFLDGIHIGFKYNQTAGGETFNWTDGTSSDYESWAPKMPNHNLGECVAMETGFITGEWVNFDCSSNLPFMCEKEKSSIPTRHQSSGCPRLNEYSSGDDIYSPSFPHPPGVESCDYMLLGGSGTSKITITISTFEVNKCCESLQIISGLVGHTVVETLTGSIASGTQYTINSNSARLHWESTSGVNVRGWQIKMEAY